MSLRRNLEIVRGIKIANNKAQPSKVPTDNQFISVINAINKAKLIAQMMREAR